MEDEMEPTTVDKSKLTLSRQENKQSMDAANNEIDALKKALRGLQETPGTQDAGELRDQIIDQLEVARNRRAEFALIEWEYMYFDCFKQFPERKTI
jgi:uncharacterized coiled-coil DUF342 family protein